MCGTFLTGQTSGAEASSTYEGRHLAFLESEMVHTYHSDGLVDKGDLVIVGNIVGIAFDSAVAATDLIAIDTEGIWYLTVLGTNEAGNIAVSPGDQIYVHKTTPALSKNSNKNTHQRFGVALGDVVSGVTTTVIAVKVHGQDDDAEELVGTAAAQYTSSVVDKKFREYRYACSAASGDARGIYNRLYLTGAGGGGESLRSYTELVAVTGATAHGAHISLGFGEATVAGSITGLGVAVRATLGLPDAALKAAGGTYAALQAEIYAFGAGSTPVGSTRMSFLRFCCDGNGTGKTAINTSAFLMELAGFTAGGGLIFDTTASAATGDSTLKICIDGVTKYLLVADDAN